MHEGTCAKCNGAKVGQRRRIAEAKGRPFYDRATHGFKGQAEGWRKRFDPVAKAARAQAKVDARYLAGFPLHDEHVKTMRADGARLYRWRYANEPEFVLHERLRRQFRKKSEAVPGLQDVIGRAIRNGCNSPTVERVLGYSMRTLLVHLERQFVKGMTLQGWGRSGWHIDHIHPRKCFDLTTLDGVRSYWALPNLRPLWAKDNIKKHANVETLL